MNRPLQQAPLTKRRVYQVLRAAAERYPNDQIAHQLADIPRVAFNILLATSRFHSFVKPIRLADIGGGQGLFSVGCAALGLTVDLVDDFGDPANDSFGNDVLPVHKEYGVRFFKRDAVSEGFHAPDEQFDIVTSFDSIEHWHQSPKRLFGEIAKALTSGGTFVLGAPNAVNLRKRITVPFGIGKWSTFQEWYEPSRFRGHVREPDIEDLRTIAVGMGLTDIKIIGKNWLGYNSRYRLVPAITRLTDLLLQSVPSLCSDIYVIGTKPSR